MFAVLDSEVSSKLMTCQHVLELDVSQVDFPGVHNCLSPWLRRRGCRSGEPTADMSLLHED